MIEVIQFQINNLYEFSKIKKDSYNSNSYINSAVTSIEYKFSLGEICDALFHEAMLCDGEQVKSLEVVNATENIFFLYINKFLPERCIPNFILSWNDYSVTN